MPVTRFEDVEGDGVPGEEVHVREAEERERGHIGGPRWCGIHQFIELRANDIIRTRLCPRLCLRLCLRFIRLRLPHLPRLLRLFLRLFLRPQCFFPLVVQRARYDSRRVFTEESRLRVSIAKTSHST